MRQGESQGSVSVERVNKIFGDKFALERVDLKVEQGSFTVLLGPSGSGKTTLLRCIGGVEFPSTGQIRIGGRVVASSSQRVPPERRGLSMVFQDYALWPHMNVISNVTFALRRTGMAKTQAEQKASALLERMGLSKLIRRYPNELSGGEQQRVALARALVADVKLVLFDEPLSNLDADLREHLRIEISTLIRDSGATALYITHDQREALALADRIAILRQGQIVQYGTPEEIFNLPASAFVARFTGMSAELPIAEVDVGLAVDRAAPFPMDRGSSDSSEVIALDSGTWSRAKMVTVRLPDSIGGRAFHALAPNGVVDATRARLFVRAHSLAIVRPGEDAHILGEVRDVAFRGDGYEHAAITQGGHLVTHLFSRVRYRRGDTVGIVTHPSGCFVLEADDDG